MCTMRTYRKSSFPPWVTKNLKNLLAKKKKAHKNLIVLISIITFPYYVRDVNLNLKNYIDPIYVECRSGCEVIIVHSGTMPAKAKVVKEFLKRFIWVTYKLRVIKYQIYLPLIFPQFMLSHGWYRQHNWIRLLQSNFRFSHLHCPLLPKRFS